MQEQTSIMNTEKRFAFGENWGRFLGVVDAERIDRAERSLQDMLKLNDLDGKRFLDIGSGSGLFSLAARRLGAEVHSFDFDPLSVECTRELKDRHRKGDPHWTVEEGSVLNAEYLRSLGMFDIVYSWGVLHHTGALWQALQNAALSVKEQGKLYIAIYNDQGWISRYWKAVKELYNENSILRLGIIALHFPYLFGMRYVVRLLSGRLKEERGMSIWHDMLDWLGGYPFEVAKPEEIISRCLVMGFNLESLKTCGGRNGCNEFVFVKSGDA